MMDLRKHDILWFDEDGYCAFCAEHGLMNGFYRQDKVVLFTGDIAWSSVQNKAPYEWVAVVRSVGVGAPVPLRFLKPTGFNLDDNLDDGLPSVDVDELVQRAIPLLKADTEKESGQG